MRKCFSGATAPREIDSSGIHFRMVGTPAVSAVVAEPHRRQLEAIAGASLSPGGFIVFSTVFRLVAERDGGLMSRIALAIAAAGVMVVGIAADAVQAFVVQPTDVDTVVWVGGASGEWNDANAWKNMTTNAVGNALAILGQRNGSNGMNSLDPALSRARNIEIGGGAVVEYYFPLANATATSQSDFRVKQGSTLTIRDGAVLVQEVDSTYTESGWFEMDPSSLVLDGGTIRRTGEIAEETAGEYDGNGVLIFGSYYANDNFNQLPPPAVIEVTIKNGGRIENTGTLWFGAEEDHPSDLQVGVTINGGMMDLTGGDNKPNIIGSLPILADLAFFYDYDEGFDSDPFFPRPKNEQYEINFTGNGSIVVDRAGIYVYTQDEFGVWTGGDAPVTYEHLWAEGILRANGLSGLDGASFDEFFTTSGVPGMGNYTLTSLVGVPEPAGAMIAVMGLAGVGLHRPRALKDSQRGDGSGPRGYPSAMLRRWFARRTA
jgi:hypothetical protein